MHLSALAGHGVGVNPGNLPVIAIVKQIHRLGAREVERARFVALRGKRIGEAEVGVSDRQPSTGHQVLVQRSD